MRGRLLFDSGTQPCFSRFRWSLFSPKDRALVAVSGGSDSLCLLHALHAGRERQGLAGVEAAHLDHGLRGEELAAEAAWVADWCNGHGIPCHLGKADVARLAAESRCSKQEAARTARYAFLEQIAAQIGATKIATGHTQDDQTETVLLHILRGTGLDGLRGIPAVRGLYVRPLLDVSRAEIEAYCSEHGLTPRRDPSNFSPEHYTRNRIRLELLPLLEQDYNPAVADALLRLSEIAARDSDYLHQQAAMALANATRERDVFHLTLDRPALAVLHPALLRHVLRQAIHQLRGTTEGVSYEHLEWASRAVSEPFAGVGSLTLSHPICLLRVTSEMLTLSLTNVSAALAYVSVPLPIPGEAILPETEWAVRADYESGTVALDADAIVGNRLTLRNWRFGDKIAPLGMGGHTKKISDIFGRAKVLKSERHRVPIVGDDAGILWIVGHHIAERTKVTPATTRRLFLTATRRDEK